ncbi:MAG: amidohydrolase family protein, partial [Candidatus Promineifilaceae bacterium]
MDQDIVFKNAAIYTVDADHSWAEAVAISGGNIAFIGQNVGAESYISSGSKVLDLGGMMVLPGFSDAHAHPSHAMDYVSNINLYGLDSVEEYMREISEYAKGHRDAAFLRGGG